MDFTREPIIETIITPREGYRLVVRSSKSVGQEEHFVDAVEVVSFGNALFFRSLERPKPFIVPIGDYEILEVREPRMVLKTGPVVSSVKIAGGREGQYKQPREQREPRERDREREREKEVERKEIPALAEAERPIASEDMQSSRLVPEVRGDKRRDRRRGFRRRRGMRDEVTGEELSTSQQGVPQFGPHEFKESELDFSQSEENRTQGQEGFGAMAVESPEPLGQTTLFRSILPPPETLIRDDLRRLRENEIYRGAFFLSEKDVEDQDDDDSSLASIESDRAPDGEHLGQELLPDLEKQEASIQEEPFLVTEAVENEIQPDHSKNFS